MRAVLSRPFLIGASLFAAFLLERVFAGVASGSVYTPPFLLLAVLAWFPRLSLPARLWIGGSIGFLIDFSAAAPFGTTILLLLFLAVATEFLRAIISHRDSLVAKGVMIGSLIFLAAGCAPLIARVINYLRL